MNRYLSEFDDCLRCEELTLHCKEHSRCLQCQGCSECSPVSEVASTSSLNRASEITGDPGVSHSADAPENIHPGPGVACSCPLCCPVKYALNAVATKFAGERAEAVPQHTLTSNQAESPTATMFSGNSTFHTQRAVTPKDVHVTQAASRESDRHLVAPKTLDWAQERNGCAAKTDMPCNHEVVPADVSRASAAKSPFPCPINASECDYPLCVAAGTPFVTDSCVAEEMRRKQVSCGTTQDEAATLQCGRSEPYAHSARGQGHASPALRAAAGIHIASPASSGSLAGAGAGSPLESAPVLTLEEMAGWQDEGETGWNRQQLNDIARKMNRIAAEGVYRGTVTDEIFGAVERAEAGVR